MKHVRLLIVAFALVSQVIMAKEPTTVWKVDKAHTSFGFSIDHMVVSEVFGQFDDFSGTVKADKPDFSDAVFKFTLQVKSIDTKNARRDADLRSPHFFDVQKYPTITFVGKKFEKVSGNHYKIVGDLTMHGITKTITLNARFGIIKDPYGKTRAGIRVSGDIDRYAFGLKWNAAIETGGFVVGQMVRLLVNVELIKA